MPLEIWSRRLSVSPNCSKLLDVDPLLLRPERRLLSPRVNASERAAERSELAAKASLRAAVTCLLASDTSCSDTRMDTTREANPWLRNRLTAVLPVRLFDEKVLPLKSLCQLLMNAEVRLGASCAWSMVTLPMFMLPVAADAVLPVSMLCRPDKPPTRAVPTPSIFFKAAQAMTGMLIARYPTTASPEMTPE